MEIRDPGGQTGAKVTTEGKLETYAVTEAESLHVNEEEGQTYSIIFDSPL